MAYMKSKAMAAARAQELSTPCQAVQVSDQMNCHRCGLVWDVNDPERPECIVDPARAQLAGHVAVLKSRQAHAEFKMTQEDDSVALKEYWRGRAESYADVIKELEKT